MATKAPSKTAGKLTPLNDHVIVERIEAQSTTKGGIVLPDTAKEKPKDRIIFSSYAGTEVKYGGEDYLIVREDEILAVVK